MRSSELLRLSRWLLPPPPFRPHAASAPASAVAELEVVRRFYACPVNEALPTGISAAPRVSVAQRFVVYGLVWLLAVVAFELWLRPWTPTESHLTEAEQRIRW